MSTLFDCLVTMNGLSWWEGLTAIIKKFKGRCFIWGEVLPRHELDTNADAYKKILDQTVIPALYTTCPNQKDFQSRIKKVVRYMASQFTNKWDFGVELTYRMVAPPEHQTPENIKKMYILRATMDLTFGMLSLLDDIVYEATFRRNQVTWQGRCPGGTGAAIYDGALLGYYANFLIKTYFRSDPGYAIMMEQITDANMKCKMGQIMDLEEQRKDCTLDIFLGFISFKAGDVVAPMPVLGAAHAGVLNEDVLRQLRQIFWKFGVLTQIWDDFHDYYNGLEQTGGPPCDINKSRTTWVNTTAQRYFNEKQKKIYEDCYGSPDPEKVEAVLRLYDEVDIPRLYIEVMRNNYLDISKDIESLPEKRFKDPCYSYMNWLIRDVCDPYFEETKKRLKL